MADLVNVNGTISPAAQAVIPVMDHGFLYGDGVYETVRTYDGQPYLLARHLKRLERSCSMIRIAMPPAAHVDREVRRTLAEAANAESYIRIMVTRGPGPIGYDPALCPAPGLVVLVFPLRPVPAAHYAEGIAVSLGARRRNPIDALDPAIKSCNLLNNVLAHMEAQDDGAVEGILLNTRGHVAEGTHTNVFFVAGSALKTPSLECGILEGITREVVLEVAREAGIPAEEGLYPREAIEAADEVFITSTLQEVVPVTRLAGRAVGGGRPGPMTLRLLDLFRRRVRSSGGR